MKRILIIIIMMLCMTTGVKARGIDPKADSIAVQQMRERMDQIRQYHDYYDKNPLHLQLFIFVMFSRKHTACRKDIFSA